MHLISEYIRGAVREVFSTMLSMEALCREDISDEAGHPVKISGVTGSISFTGKMNGMVYLTMSPSMARAVTGSILGLKQAEVGDEEIGDVVGELTNMVTGNLKSKMTDQGYNCTLSIPTVLMGNEILVESSQSNIKTYNEFRITGQTEPVGVYVFARLEGT